jgi:hypothetical protein
MWAGRSTPFTLAFDKYLNIKGAVPSIDKEHGPFHMYTANDTCRGGTLAEGVGELGLQ